MLEYVSTGMCRMQYLREALDDDDAAPCGRCDRCTGRVLSSDVDAALVGAADTRLSRPGVPLEPRRMWPSGMAALGVPLSGRIPAGEQAGSGRAVARLTDLGWGEQRRDLFAPETPDGELPVPLRHAMAEVVRSWHLDQPPDVVVGMGSVTRPALVDHLADGMSRFLGLPLVARFHVTGADVPGAGSANSAQRLRTVAGRFTLDRPDAVTGRKVLLVDDRSDSGWTLAVAARELRRAGATSVHPLVLGLG